MLDSPDAVREDVHLPGAGPELPDDEDVANNHDDARNEEYDEKLVNSKHR